MVTFFIIKYLLCDDSSLDDYRQGNIPSFDDIKRRLFLLDRQTGMDDIPDHYYQLNKEYSFNGIKTLPEIFTKGLHRIANTYLELRNNRVYVKQNMQNQWQELITYIPPLVSIASLLSKRFHSSLTSMEAIREFYHEYIVPNTKYTALVGPYLPQLEQYVEKNHGFHDTHMHLNGSTETDVVWQDVLLEPDKTYKNLQKGYEQKLVKEQYEQESHFLKPLTYRKLLRTAQRLRYYFFYILFSKGDCFQSKKHLFYILNEQGEEELIEIIPDSICHPFYKIIHANELYNGRELLSIEALMYVLLFKYLLNNPREAFASSFHYYLLILGLTNRILVQQTDQKGFVQFQKITLNELRETSEQQYLNRFFQVRGNDLKNIYLLEGRFALKNTCRELEKLLANIEVGWTRMVKEANKELNCTNNTPPDFPKLQLVAHFIKEVDNKPNDFIRHKDLRCKVWNQALILSYLKNKSPYLEKVMGIDTASSEFAAPPEVFAPAYRMLRRNGFKHFTYHAGEDFYHILSGLRAIYEAVEFNDLQAGDRIGHATASGLSPKVWERKLGKSVLMKKGEYMDDLLFVYHFIVRRINKCSVLEPLKQKIIILADQIQEYSYEIYHRPYSLKALEEAYMFRQFCPMIMRMIAFVDKEADGKFKKGKAFQRAEELSVFDFNEFCAIRNEFHCRAHNESVEIYLNRYHNKYFRDEYNEIIEIDIKECFTLNELERLQLAILQYLNEKEIVIETLPTSNVRIGFHTSFETYHLWNWIKWEEEGRAIPPIVVGTDDAGIFATNIFNEYANIYCFLTDIKQMSHLKTMEILRNLEHNASIYKFD